MCSSQSLAGILFDLDGVLYIGDQVVPGAIATLETIKSQGIPCRFITNTSTKTAHDVALKLRAMRFDIEEEEIFSAVSATRDYLRKQDSASIHLLVGDAAKAEFLEFDQQLKQVDFVVVGDIGAAWDYELLNTVFNELMNGATLVAMHKNKFWQTEDGLRMDIGAFVAGLEFVSGKQAVIIGKPAAEFFSLARDSLPNRTGKVIVVGDDIENDVGGGQSAGLSGVLVRTGKYREELVANSGVVPDAIIDSIACLPDYLDL